MSTKQESEKRERRRTNLQRAKRVTVRPTTLTPKRWRFGRYEINDPRMPFI